MAIETRKDQIEKLDWEIKPRDEKAAQKSDSRIKALTEFWRKPDGERPFATWLREILEDVLVIDAPCLEVLNNRDGSLRGRSVVGSRCVEEAARGAASLRFVNRRITAPRARARRSHLLGQK
jgi:hypothetical protein